MAGRPPPLEALKASLRVVRLPEAYVIYYASTGLLEKELFAIEPHAPITVGFGSARGIDPTGYPLARRSLSKAEPGVWFS